MVNYNLIDELIRKSMSMRKLTGLHLSKDEKRFLKDFNAEMIDYAKDPAAEDEVKMFYRKVYNKYYKYTIELLHDVKVILTHSSDDINYPHLRDNSLKLLETVTQLISRHIKPTSLEAQAHFQHEVRGDLPSLL